MQGQLAWQRASNDLRRELVDAEGRVWEVFEMSAPSHDRLGGCALVFASPDIVRRVRDYPADWYKLELPRLKSILEGE